MTSKDIVVAAKAQLNDVEIQTFPKDVNVKKLITNMHHLGKFYTPVAAANDDSDENEESENSNISLNSQNISDV
ncbi:hypothetical protein DdX_15024 [Ditylenchus destructor]|uniref:Uncharacterized protein n=1 Tax=Ditylenchus destructor TaxID=166010 RepID=A0AAD4R191_9BILA|nr:hypothetical protein DdX_15024 [Ditylenchus destructor]